MCGDLFGVYTPALLYRTVCAMVFDCVSVLRGRLAALANIASSSHNAQGGGV